MDHFWDFAGHFWWLVFPLMGVAGGAVRTWQRDAKGRHERKLETIRVKAELKAAQAEARNRGRQKVVAAASTPAQESHEQQLQKLLDAHDAATKRWLDYELDVAKLIAFPAMSDGRQPLTAAFLRAKKVADRLRPASPKVKLSKEQLDEYRNAVTDFEVAFDVAEREARRLKDSTFSELERKRLDTAKQLLTVAVDQAATPAERQLAYKRVREELDGLISISDDAIEVLEKKVALQLPAGATPEPIVHPTASPAPATWPAPRRDTSAPDA
ncbi:hypothetical protein ET475_07125 [Microbacterium protaetiae]|uniref:Uncharacterized protein n=1 Tax=Microbacterium protaetiae TaxID=2509458 RepID=A0A4P6EEI7_9MICO|nr:hypothetical protein [Microbacterium protaetiae]QAY59783.1 hypothetical protein ET475_07125 [Microbacterium protaetiae]